MPDHPFPCLVCGKPCPYGKDGYSVRRQTCSSECLTAYFRSVAQDRMLDAEAMGLPPLPVISPEERARHSRRNQAAKTPEQRSAAGHRAVASRDEAHRGAALSRHLRPDQKRCAAGLHPWAPENLYWPKTVTRTQRWPRCLACSRARALERYYRGAAK